MATPPLVCSSGSYNQFQGIVMDRCEIKMLEGTTVKSTFSLCDFGITLDDFSSFSTCLEPGLSLLLNPEGIDMNGEVKLIIIRVTYPSSLDPSLRYINFTHQGKVLPIGDIMILSGNPAVDAPGRGWDLSPDGTDISSPYFEQGGMILYNPHTARINIQVILGSNPPNTVSTSNGDYLVSDDGFFITSENGYYIDFE
jgi:hypothetical protein